MEFLYPTALYGLLALPLLLIPYLIRRKPRRIVFSSLLLFSPFGSRRSGQPLGKLRLPPIFFLQLLLLTLLILALGEPVFSVRASNIAIVLDNSASMQTVENQQTRFALAQGKARGLIADLGGAGKVDVYHTVPRFEKVRGGTFAPGEAAAIIGGLAPYDLADAPIDYQSILSQIANEQKYDRVYLITDHPAVGQTGVLRIITVGEPKGNFAISSFHVTRSSLVGTGLEASVEVANFSAKDERIKIVVRGAGTIVSSRQVPIGAGRSAAVTFEGLPPHPYYEAEIELRDALALDNRRFAAAPASQNLRILGISPRPQAVASLRSVPGVNLELIAPDQYERTDRSAYGLEIFHFATPAVLPANPALFVLPPDNNPLVDLGQPLSRVAVSTWREPHPLTRYVNFALFRPGYARPVRPQTSGETIIGSASGALAFASEQRGVRQMVLGFDPFPYLGRENLPMSVFTLNLLDWFFHGSGTTGRVTGEPLGFAAAQQGTAVLTPSGDRIDIRPGVNNFSETFLQGVYQLNRGGHREFFAVNLENRTESDLRAPTPIAVRDPTSARSGSSVLLSIWPYLLLIALLLLLIEWFANPRAVRARFRTGSAL
jgi:hypothetical protein